MTREYSLISAENFSVLAHKTRWQILQLIAQESQIYAKQIALKLNLSESKVHYHLNLLRNAGLIISLGEKKVNRGKVKLFGLLAHNFTFSIKQNALLQKTSVFNEIIREKYCPDEIFIGKIIVGAAEPHGKFDALSRDGYLAGDLCWYLGSHLPIQQLPYSPFFVMTDSNYKIKSPQIKDNLILIGGPITNILTETLNSHLKRKFGVYFLENRLVYQNKEFAEPSHGIISIIRENDKWILILAGVRSLGTQAAIHAIITDSCDLLVKDAEFITVIRGKSSNAKEITQIEKVMVQKAETSV